MAVPSWHVLINGEPYMFKDRDTGIVLGDSLIDPAPPMQLGSSIIENVAAGIGPKLARGNGYYDIHRLIPTVEGQLIFPPMASVGAEFSLSGSQTWTPGIFHHPCPAGQYIAFGSRIYRLNLTDFAGLTYTLVASSDCTAAPISNANARYSGGAFVWRNRIYFGIENSLNGQAVGYAWIDFVVDDDLATIVNDADKGFSYGAASRGRLFIAQNQATPNHTKLKWSSSMSLDYTAMVDGTDLFGDTTTVGGTFVYGIEGRPRVSWVLMLGSAALFFRDDGSVLASDEAGFIGVASPRSQSSGTQDPTQGFGAVHYLDGAAFNVFAGGPHHLNPVTLLTRSLSPGNVQDIPIEAQDPDMNCLYAVGEHLLMGSDRFLYDVMWTTNNPVVHKLMNLQSLCANSNYVSGAMTQQGGILAVTMYNPVSQRFQQLQLEVLPSLRTSAAVYSGAALQGWIEPGILVGPDRSASMTKLWLQVRGAYFTRANAANTLSFTNAFVDGTKAVSIDSVTAEGPFAAAITASPQINRLGRTLQFRMNMNPQGYTGFNERVYFPLVADFLWAPTISDRLTLSILATSEQLTRAGGVLTRRSARNVVDALSALTNTVITLQFSDGDPRQQWSMFVEAVDATRDEEAESAYGTMSYLVKMVARRL